MDTYVRTKLVVGTPGAVNLIPQIRSMNPANRTIEFVSSTQAIDRYGDRIMVKGWDLKNYLLNPIVLFGHRSKEPPIGMSTQTVKELTGNPALVNVVQFVTKDAFPFGDMIYKMLQEKILRAVSVGFNPLEEPTDIKDDNGQVTGYEYTSQELLELSVVPIPANPEALARAITRGYFSGANEVDAYLKNVRGMCGDDNPAWSNLAPGVTYSIDTTEKKDEASVNPTNTKLEAIDNGDGTERIDLFAIEREQKDGSIRTRMQFSKEACETFKMASDAVQSISKRFDEVLAQQAALLEKVVNLEQKFDRVMTIIPAKAAAPADPAMGDICDSVADLGNTIDKMASVASEAQKKHAVVNHKVNNKPAPDPGEPDADDKAAKVPVIKRSVVPYAADPITDAPWDAATETAKEDSPEGWERMSTVIDGDAKLKGSYKLPHHMGGSFQVNANGVRAAAGRLEQTEMQESDRPGARSHIAKHQKAIADKNGTSFDEGLFTRNLADLGQQYRTAIKLELPAVAAIVEGEIAKLIDKHIPIAEAKPKPAGVNELLSSLVKN